LGHYHVYTFDETLPKFMKRKHPQKGREKETRGKDQRPKSKQANSPKMASQKGGNGTLNPKPPPVAYLSNFSCFFVRMGNNYTMLSLWTLLKAPISY
jgi:hypothetical protein